MPVPEDQLPLELPDVESYVPTDNGESPLAAMRSWVAVSYTHLGYMISTVLEEMNKKT